MLGPRITRIFIFAVVVLVGIYDLFAAAFLGGAESTITVQLYRLSLSGWKGITFCFAVGYLMGHIFGRIDENSEFKPQQKVKE